MGRGDLREALVTGNTSSAWVLGSHVLCAVVNVEYDILGKAGFSSPYCTILNGAVTKGVHVALILRS